MPEPRTGSPRNPRNERTIAHAATQIGWRHEVLVDDPGPPPRRPAPPERVEVSPEWVEAQRGDEQTTNRPLTTALRVLAGLALLALALWPLRILPGVLAFGAVCACAVVAVPVGVALLQSRRVIADRVAEERARLEAERRAAEGELRRLQEEHAARHAAWQAWRHAFEAQPQWYTVHVPEDAGAVLVAGGTDAGWSAVLTCVGASRLGAGADLTVVDLSGRAVAGDLVALVRRSGVVPRIWVLPADLPRMNLGAGLGAGGRAAVLAAVASAAQPEADSGADTALLEGILEAVGAEAGVDAVVGGLRTLAVPEDAPDAGGDPAVAALTDEQRADVRKRCGTDRAVVERAWELAGHLAPFEGVGTRAQTEPYAQVKVIATDRAGGEVAARAYGAYTAAALCRLLEMRAQAAGSGERTDRWGRAILVCGADALPAEAVDRLIDAAEAAATGLVLLVPEADADTVARFDSGRVHPVLMRQPDGASAARLADWLGDQPELRLHRLTEVIGEALSGTVADSYAEDAEPGQAATAPVSVRGAASAIAPLDLARDLRAATTWGRATSQAEGADGARTLHPDAHGLRHLPPTAAVVPGAHGAVLADANPGILTLPTATLSSVEDGPPAAPAEPAGGDGAPPPNLGPPPERLDWRWATS
ncbi:hypothetical protein [Nocardiopsis coralliicola]